MRIRQKSDYTIHNWGGGSTTELYIFPENSTYKERNFDFRLSIATIEVKTSTFTKLPGIHRTLLLLEGQIALNHSNQHNSLLMPGLVDQFEGDWETTSEGTGTDFNLMTYGNTQGNLSLLKLNAETPFSIENSNSRSFCYVYKGRITLNENHYFEGDLLQLTDSLTNGVAIQHAELIVINIEH